ncbi:4-coumarate--CoA ligase-like 7 [Tolypocladium paradoxum]|uniref:4-coumarate--CoA ligase-like 7 n=1 Tax=Tolypocladium paradoxum TaxID=94208 RepID=A0A2S4KYX3_9HYPO|nr:4-coumarate--CoA ligase-like 7 [Tolypocladium paradoxum]
MQILYDVEPGTFGPGPTKPNTSWLSAAIRHAKSLQAHHMFSDERTRKTAVKTTVLLRRLCCLIRDRILSLGLHRELQIPEKYPPLSPEDLENEMRRSRVYNLESKQRMLEIFTQTSRLCVTLTNLLQLSAASKHDSDFGMSNARDQERELADCTGQLRDWYSEAQQ